MPSDTPESQNFDMADPSNSAPQLFQRPPKKQPIKTELIKLKPPVQGNIDDQKDMERGITEVRPILNIQNMTEQGAITQIQPSIPMARLENFPPPERQNQPLREENYVQIQKLPIPIVNLANASPQAPATPQKNLHSESSQKKISPITPLPPQDGKIPPYHPTQPSQHSQMILVPDLLDDKSTLLTETAISDYNNNVIIVVDKENSANRPQQTSLTTNTANRPQQTSLTTNTPVIPLMPAKLYELTAREETLHDINVQQNSLNRQSNSNPFLPSTIEKSSELAKRSIPKASTEEHWRLTETQPIQNISTGDQVANNLMDIPSLRTLPATPISNMSPLSVNPSNMPASANNPSDTILMQIHLLEAGSQLVQHGYYFTFTSSRLILWIGSTNSATEPYLILTQATIMPRHAFIRYQNQSLYLQHEDGQTWLNQTKLLPHENKLLPNQCQIKFGDLVFHCFIRPPDQAIIQQSSEFSEQKVTLPLPVSQFNNQSTNIQQKQLQETSKVRSPDSGFVIAEFALLCLDLLPCAVVHRGEILSSRLEFSIGQSPLCDYQVEFGQKYVAGKQALIQYAPQKQIFTIKNLVPSNNIFVNNQPVTETQLNPGDIIKLGGASGAPRVKFDLVENIKPPPPKSPAKELLLDALIPHPQRGATYSIGNSPHSIFALVGNDIPEQVAEIVVPSEGDYFLVRKVSEHNIPVLLDSQLLAPTVYAQERYGVNQLLRIGDLLLIRNNQRILPPEIRSFPWKKVVSMIFLCIGISVAIVLSYLAVQANWPKIQSIIAQQNRVKQYEKNVWYIAYINTETAEESSGTGFLLTQKDAFEQDILYVVTCKHVVQPWKFQPHKIQDNQIYNRSGKVIASLDDTNIKQYLAVWPNQSQVMNTKQNNSFILENSFCNAPIINKLGNLEIHCIAKDEYIEYPDGFKEHNSKSNLDVVILKVVPNKNWKYSYHTWQISDKKTLEVHETVMVLGYPSGRIRLLTKQGMAVPASIEGKFASECTSPGFLEIDANQTQGASGGPVVNQSGQIVGMVSFSDKEKRLIYGIHGQVLSELMK